MVASDAYDVRCSAATRKALLHFAGAEMLQEMRFWPVGRLWVKWAKKSRRERAAEALGCFAASGFP